MSSKGKECHVTVPTGVVYEPVDTYLLADLAASHKFGVPVPLKESGSVEGTRLYPTGFVFW